MKTKFIDFHTHSLLKPYSKSFKTKALAGKNTTDNERRSIWFKTKLNIFKKALNAMATLTKFTQADFRSAYEGGAKVVIVSIDPMERELILSRNREKKRKKGKLLLDLVQGIGKKRMNYLFDLNDYFSDLTKSYHYLFDLQNVPKTLGGKSVTYRLAETYDQLDFSNEETINIILSMEGGHVFNSNIKMDLADPALKTQMLANINTMKSEWEFTPFFVSPAHHFKNGLCGQAKSLTGIAGLAYKQHLDANQGITAIGYAVIDSLLSKENGKRIFIDMKHMNLKSRKDCIEYLTTGKYQNEKIPLISSHGAVNNGSRPSNNTEINFYKEDVLAIAKSGGIFGVQLDARRLRKTKYGSKRRGLNNSIERKGLYKRAFFVWRQIEMTALWVYEKKKTDPAFEAIDPWGFQVIGSDFDGVVDPLDGYWTHSHIPLLHEYLLLQARTFLATTKAMALPDYLKLFPQLIVNKFMFENANGFLQTHFSANSRT